MNGSTPTVLAPSSSAAPAEVHDVPPRSSFAFDSMEDAIAAFARGSSLWSPTMRAGRMRAT
ncbi:hypothetical protein A0H81_13205 [Grifola frondosa]|uniref:Uncharacterized protein n=1 Tax=Grifola frondosa TaxID=5627 RepID=A0A1C7LQ08_GRIFR|nr:hypothetical protein A0H81_13205 [Grifola frondosa]